MFTQSTLAVEKPWQKFSSTPLIFSYPQNSWKKPVAKKVDAVALENPDDKPDGVAPTHQELTIDPVGLKIYLIPTAEQKLTAGEFKKRYPTVVSAAGELGKILKTTKASGNSTPSLPWEDASTPFEAKKSQLKFANGKAVRYIAEYLIEPDVVDNARLVYTAQGLTDDGKWYISVVAPIKTKSLPDKSDISKWPQASYKKFSDGFSNYGHKVGQKLEKLASASFTPDLSTLDRLVQSISIK